MVADARKRIDYNQSGHGPSQILKEENAVARRILEQCTLYIIPMLNPDGARAYTRVNAVNIDLNRDAADISQPESFALRRVFDEIAPDFCFNLHDQRTIFNTGDSPKPATLSFLSPATNKERSITPPRKKSMEVIAAVNTVLQRHIRDRWGGTMIVSISIVSVILFRRSVYRPCCSKPGIIRKTTTGI